MARRRVVQLGVGIGILIVAGIVVGGLLQSGVSRVNREASMEAAVLELSTWRSGQPGLEDVTIRRARRDLPFIIVEGTVATDADIERLMDRIEMIDGVEFHVQVTLPQKSPEEILEETIGTLPTK